MMLVSLLSQASWLLVVALGMNLVLLTAGVDLSVGAGMYLAATVVSLAFPAAPLAVCILVAVVVGALLGSLNGLLVVMLRLPAFIVTLATVFIARGFSLFLSDTRIVFAAPAVATFGRQEFAHVPAPVWLAAIALALSFVLMNVTPLGPYMRSLGHNAEQARRAGVPADAVTFSAYCLCGAFAGLGGFISLSQTSAVSGAFGLNNEFLAIAAAVLGGTSLFGGRGTQWAPLIGTLVITAIQSLLARADANPYAYPVVTGAVIFLAALIDSVRLRTLARLHRERIRGA
jgi:ribose transport system permease protein